MICKFFKEHKGGGVASINYLLDKRTLQGTARVLKGDEFLTRELIKSMSQKHKTCMGVLCFEEENIKEEHKKEIMESFENALLTQEMQGRYNILWVEHTDKGRLELNFVIPKIDLESKKAFNPYFHKADNKRIEIWGDFVNLCYGFTNPKDPRKEQTIQGSKKAKQLFKNYEELDKILHEQVKQGVINSRPELISFLELNSIQVTRQGNDYISVKLPESQRAKRFKGSIYNERFRSTEELERIRREKETRARAYQQRDIKAECERVKRELDKLIQSKNEFYREAINRANERLRKKNKRSFKQDRTDQLQQRADEIQVIEPSDKLSSGNAYNDDFFNDCVVEVDRALSNQQGVNNHGQSGECISMDTQRRDERTREPLFLFNQVREENDSTRERINSRNREIARDDLAVSKERKRVIENFGYTNARTRENARYDGRRKGTLSGEYQEFKTGIAGARLFLQGRISRVREYIQREYQTLADTIKRSFKQVVKKVEKVKENVRGWGMGW
ncbi:TPA_asm: mobilization protein [Campylobacter jejuni]|nr:relaxase/mobilization nuclease domain-containing protein [Campylobacter jejuni]HAA1937292.1 mobilization protein [Campylobacter jejuni]